jgi:hypothetical protein
MAAVSGLSRHFSSTRDDDVCLVVCLLERLRESFDFGCVYVTDDEETQAVRLPGFDGEGVVTAGFGGGREGQGEPGCCLEDEDRDFMLAHGYDKLCARLLVKIDDASS